MAFSTNETEKPVKDCVRLNGHLLQVCDKHRAEAAEHARKIVGDFDSYCRFLQESVPDVTLVTIPSDVVYAAAFLEYAKTISEVQDCGYKCPHKRYVSMDSAIREGGSWIDENGKTICFGGCEQKPHPYQKDIDRVTDRLSSPDD